MLRAASVFSDKMVLQQGKPVSVFGKAEPGRIVEVELTQIISSDDMSRKLLCISTAEVKEDGTWCCTLSPASAGTGYELEITCDNEQLLFVDVALGEVFLAGGQSNMELELQNCKEGPHYLEQGSIPEDIRFYYTQKRSYFDADFEKDEAATGWQSFGDEWTCAWSAVGFFFALKLARELKCPIGIIGCNWGGTSAACWMSREALLDCASTSIYVEEYDASPDIAGKSEEEQIHDYEEYVKFHSEWDRKCGELYAARPEITWDEVQDILGPCRYPGPMNCASFLRPAGLYETMLKRVAPYTLRGFIYYQGENDDHRPYVYYDLMKGLIRQWRSEWKDVGLYFFLTQLPMHRYLADEDSKNWCIIREAQAKIAATVQNTGVATAIDQGEFNEIHPKRKQRVGERLALQALKSIYGRLPAEEADAPCLKGYVIKKGGIALEFRNACGFTVKPREYGEEPWRNELEKAAPADRLKAERIIEATAKGCPTGFEICGSDGIFHEAEARIEGNGIRVYSDKVPEPTGVRYLWSNYSEVNLYGMRSMTEPLPVMPFNTTLG